MKLIQTITLGTAATTISFTSLPQDATDLVILASVRTSRNSYWENVYFGINNATGPNQRSLLADSGSVFSLSETEITFPAPAATATANTFGNVLFYVPNYTSTQAKSISYDAVTENNASAVYLKLAANNFPSSTAINTFTITSALSTLVAGSTVSVYKITKGSDGITTAS